jgi:hypothetical protein
MSTQAKVRVQNSVLVRVRPHYVIALKDILLSNTLNELISYIMLLGLA